MSKAKTNLVIVESPAKARTIEKYLGSDYKVVASMGHLRDLPKSTLGVDVERDFEPQYKSVEGREAIISDLRKSSKSAKTVFLAQDADPALTEPLAELAGSKDVPVIWTEHMKELGKACGIAVGSAVAAIV